MLIPLGRVPAWIVAMMISREIAVTGLRAIASDMGVVIEASRMGKYKTISQIISLVPLIVHFRFYGIDFHEIGTVFLLIAFFLTMWSGIDYFVKFFKTYSLQGD